MLTDRERDYLLVVFANGPRRIGKDFASGHGGIHRPSTNELLPHVNSLIEQNLVKPEVVESPNGRGRGQWAIVLTNQGKVMAKILGSAA